MTNQNEAELARLKAAALAAEAVAAEARAAAAKAELEAAMAGSTPVSPTTEAPNESAPAKSDAPQPLEQASFPDEYSGIVSDGYTFSTPVLTIGSYLRDGEVDPNIRISLPLAMLNRHGLVAGATGTGKTRTLQLLAEGMSDVGIPVFITDIKGDLTGLIEAGTPTEKLLARVSQQGQDWKPSSHPVDFFTLGGQGTGTPIRTTVSDFGPILLAKVLGLNETQESALLLIFHWADTNRLALIDLGDLKSVVTYLTSTDGKSQLAEIGGISATTAGVILREISELQSQGGDSFFGEPAFNVNDFLRIDTDGRAVISSLELPDIQGQSSLFSTFIMWLLAELFQVLPEVGDADKPKLVFFFDEAHLLFTDATPEFLKQVVQTVRLIRSKGVGIFFVTQSPKDIPDDVLAQLGAKIQHALRAHTPNDAKALRETVKTYPTSPLDLEKLLPSLGTGEAIITLLDPKGRPTPVAPVRLWAPSANMGMADPATVNSHVHASPLFERYKNAVNPESATELLEARIAQEAAQRTSLKELEEQVEAEKKVAEAEQRRLEREAAAEQKRAERRRDSLVDSIMRTAGRTITREITRSLFGTRRR
ncbi:helicase HerA-like domain-containing protein [Arcanobacterium ihumii]|uniref:helicase HerA-like domain-containing protein n=1 Tax=Arcanobacterium ihumii TaxID=2138162 RepID=UPI000F52F1D5|nr:helicase HerA-like domain-containing protein [Arcanobacterium ihumii]